MTTPNLGNPFSQEQIDDLDRAKKAIPTLRAEIRRAESAGIDMTRQKEQLAELEKKVEGIYGAYLSGSNKVTRRSA